MPPHLGLELFFVVLGIELCWGGVLICVRQVLPLSSALLFKKMMVIIVTNRKLLGLVRLSWVEFWLVNWLVLCLFLVTEEKKKETGKPIFFLSFLKIIYFSDNSVSSNY